MLSVSEAVPILEDTQVELKQSPLRAAQQRPALRLSPGPHQMRTRSATSTTPELHPGIMSRWRKALITAPSTCKPSVTPAAQSF